MASFANKVVLITGASSGIGRGTAVEFAKKGGSLGLVGRNKGRLEEVAQECIKQGVSKDKVLVLTGDMTKESDIEQIYKDAVKYFGKLDVVVNNAGFAHIALFAESTLGHLDDMYKIYVRGVYQLSKLVHPQLKETKGNIVNVSAGSSSKVYVGSGTYNICKAAMDHLTRQLAVELAPDGIRVNSVNPGVIRTDIFKTNGLVSTDEEAQKYYEESATKVPLGRCGEVADISKPICFLASGEAGYINGQCLIIDGGEQICG